MSAWLAAILGSLSLAAILAGVWSWWTKTKAEAQRRAEIQAQIEAARRRAELSAREVEHAKEIAAARRALEEVTEKRRAEGLTPRSLSDLHARTRKPWPPED